MNPQTKPGCTLSNVMQFGQRKQKFSILVTNSCVILIITTMMDF